MCPIIWGLSELLEQTYCYFGTPDPQIKLILLHWYNGMKNRIFVYCND